MDVNTKPAPEQEINSGDEKKKRNRIIAIIVVAVSLFCVGVLALNVFGDNDARKLEAAVAAELGQLENKSNDEIEAELNRVVEKGSMSISINANPIFVDGKSEGSIQIENSPANHYGQEVIITLDETGEEIYRSGLLLPNYHIQTDKLTVELEKGEYDCTAIFVGYNIENIESGGEPEQIGTAAAKICISVLN